MPATAALLAAIARLPNGAVVLPGLDQDLDDEGWGEIGRRDDGDGEFVHGHPQAMLQPARSRPRCKSRASRRRHARRGRRERAGPRPHSHRRRCGRPRRPTVWAAMDRAEHAGLAAAGFSGVAIVEAVDEREEALAIAIALRETLEEPGRTAALATPDRALAIRVAAELRRWDVAVEDSAGVPLSDSLGRPPRPLGGRRGGAGFPSRPRARPPGSSAAPARSRSRRGRTGRGGARARRVARTRPEARS